MLRHFFLSSSLDSSSASSYECERWSQCWLTLFFPFNSYLVQSLSALLFVGICHTSVTTARIMLHREQKSTKKQSPLISRCCLQALSSRREQTKKRTREREWSEGGGRLSEKTECINVNSVYWAQNSVDYNFGSFCSLIHWRQIDWNLNGLLFNSFIPFSPNDDR